MQSASLARQVDLNEIYVNDECIVNTWCGGRGPTQIVLEIKQIHAMTLLYLFLLLIPQKYYNLHVHM